MEKDLLSRILNGESSLEEKKEFYLQLGKDKEQEDLFYEVKSLWLRTTMQSTKVNIDEEFENLWKKIQHNTKQKSIFSFRKVFRYAAIILLFISIGGIGGYYASQHLNKYPATNLQKYTAQKGSVSTVEFSDGTKIWLNSGSELSYFEDYENKERRAQLNGEAYFEVAHKGDFPLLVNVGHLIVRDLGTTFNIKAYPEDNYIETSLVEGDADILSVDGRSLLELNPGESAMYLLEEKKIEIRPIDSNVISAWRDGKFVIRDQRLEDVFEELSRWYSVDFRFENENLREVRITGNIKKSTTALHVMKMLKLIANFNFRIIERANENDIIIVY